MLPNSIVGSVITTGGSAPFVLDTATGQVHSGSYASVDPAQRNMGSMECQAVDKQVRAKVVGSTEVRVGSYQCAKCARWIDVVKHPDDWSGNSCSRC